MNTTILRSVTAKLAEVRSANRQSEVVAIGSKGLGFLNRIGAKVVAQATRLGDEPTIDKLINPMKVMLDAYGAGRLSAVHLCYTRFVNTIKQEPVIEQLLPLHVDASEAGGSRATLYEPDAATVIEEVLLRYAEALVFEAVAENMASEQAARMVAMKAATDNAGSLIDDLTLLHNRTRQAAITRELSKSSAAPRPSEKL
jgi:F-type H+-transporting ATPase subunit gamma